MKKSLPDFKFATGLLPSGITPQTSFLFHFLRRMGNNTIHIMKKIFTFILMTAISLSAYGDQFIVTRHANNGFSKTITTDRDGNIIRKEESKPRRIITKAENEDEGTQMTIYVRLVCPDDMEPVFVWHGSATFGEYAYWEGEDVIALELDSNSTWDCENNVISAQFTKKNYTGNPEDRWTVIHKFDELKDGMEITFDASEACNKYSFRFFNPEGEQVMPNHYMYDVDTKESTLLEQKNIDSALGEIAVYDKEYQFYVQSKMFDLCWRSYSDGRPEKKHFEAPVFYLNELPEDMAIYGQLSALEKQEGDNLVTLVMTTPNVREPGEVTNNPNNYTEVITDFIPDKALEGESWLGVKLDCTLEGWINNEHGYYWDVTCEAGKTMTCSTWLCLNKATMQGVDVMQALYFPRLSPQDSDLGIMAQSMLQESGNPVIKHMNKTFGASDTSVYCRTFEYWDDYDIFKIVNDKLPASPSDYDYILGNCTPLLVSLGIWPKELGPLTSEYLDYLLDLGWFNASYCGRADEAMTQLTEVASVTQSVEGSVMTFDIDVEGAKINGDILSSNKASMQCNIDKVDWVPPTAQLLWFTEGAIVRDHFQTPENAVLHLYAADFRYTLNDMQDKDMMEAYPLESIKVEYAPHRSGEYSEIGVSENADMFFMPGYGYCYEGSLASVDRGSADGWMDLRITLSDDSGNVQTQTLSPAFRVESLSGIDEGLNDRNVNGDDTLLYDLQGRKAGSCPMPGIYVRRISGRAEKIIIK